MFKRLRKSFMALLHQGATPEKLALSVALGITLGIFPVLGSTTLLCAAAGFFLGLNQPALQSVNYIAYPLQLGLLIPFFRLGERIFGVPALAISRADVQTLIHSGVLNAIRFLWVTTMHAIVAWGLLAPFIAIGIYAAIAPVFRRLVVE